MNIKSNLKIPYFIVLIISYALFYGCAPTKTATYLKEPNLKSQLTDSQNNDFVYFVEDSIDEHIRYGDELYIRITSSDETPTNFNSRFQMQIMDADLLSYTLDEEGYIHMPYLKRIKLEGLTLQGAADLIEEELSQYLFHPSVFIKFINNKVTVLGEVNSPGVYVFNYKSINIFQAIGYANDISSYGNRRKVLIIREEGNEVTKHYFDLTKDDILVSDWYLIKSNDIIYVEPLGRKKWGMETFPYDILISVVSTTTLILTLTLSLFN